ncbi:transcriptional regulator protein YdcR [Pseudescherichia vulneris]|nr:transcriptional regulator protein YdcR [Pseudescherichia vulneris]
MDAGRLSEQALAHRISIAPGKMFSTSDTWTPFFRFNTSWAWGDREEQAAKTLGMLIREAMA